MTVTASPCATRASTRWDPINPAPPVITAFMFFSGYCVLNP